MWLPTKEATLTLIDELENARSLEDFPRIARLFGLSPAWSALPASFWPAGRGEDSPSTARSVLFGYLGELPWFGVECTEPKRMVARGIRLLARRGEPAAILALDAHSGCLALGVVSEGRPILMLRPAEDPGLIAACLERIRGLTPEGRLETAGRLAEILAVEGLGTRFFLAFERALERMAEAIPGRRPEERRSLALLQLNRVLFLYFVQSKGWLDGRPDFLRSQVDLCLARKKLIQRHVLKPLFFGTLNRPERARARTAACFGTIPFLNGGLFEPHPLERHGQESIPNDVWRSVLDDVFERFHFTAREGDGTAIAPDMLGRVFEGVMERDQRKTSGTFYTPPALVRAILEECLATTVAASLKVSLSASFTLLESCDPGAAAALANIAILDPAAGSGAFLLEALDRLARLAGDAPGARRRILQTNLFGVDINPTAIRLTELRLWLSIISHEPAGLDAPIEPLPNLDCMVRQGDSLVDPLGLIARMPFRTGAMGAPLAELRRAASEATGRSKKEAARLLRAAELAAMKQCLVTALDFVRRGIADCSAALESPDLFGLPTGSSGGVTRRLEDLRSRVGPLRQAERRLEQDGEVGWFQYEGHFADVFSERGGFDIVLGNPPWVRAEKIPQVVREHLAQRYAWWKAGTARGYRHQPDLSVAFLERAHELARPGGVVGLLLPSKIATASYGASARRALTRDLTLVTACDMAAIADSSFDATVYPMVLVSRKERPASNGAVKLRLGRKSGPVVKQESLGNGSWVLRQPQAIQVLRDLACALPSIESRFTVQLGVKTGANDVFLNPPETVERHLLRPAFRGRDIHPFDVAQTIPMLWPYDGRMTLLEDLPPGARAWIRSHSARLAARADFDGGQLWTLFRTIGAAPCARVVWPDIARRLSAAVLLEKDPRIPLNTCYLTRASSAGEAMLLAAWLNSSWAGTLARLTADPASNGFARFNARTVGSLPLPVTLFSDQDLARWLDQPIRTRKGPELDELVARHLNLSAAALRALASVHGDRPGHRGRIAG